LFEARGAHPLTASREHRFGEVDACHARGLGVLNLLPIPPLDGSALLERVLPREWLPGWYRFRPYGILVLFVLVFYVGLGSIFDPFLQRLYSFILT